VGIRTKRKRARAEEKMGLKGGDSGKRDKEAILAGLRPDLLVSGQIG
jgi:hypothetical protein